MDYLEENLYIRGIKLSVFKVSLKRRFSMTVLLVILDKINISSDLNGSITSIVVYSTG
jgi:hypothetical protein